MKKISIILSILTLICCGQLSDKDLVTAAFNGKTEVLEKAIANGADVNLKSKKGGVSLLSYAAGAGHAITVFMLLKKGADVHAIDNNGWTAIHFAASKGHTDAINMLVKFGADINSQTADGWTPLMYSVFNNDEITTKNLLQNGANKTIKMDNGIDAYGIANEKGFKQLLPILR